MPKVTADWDYEDTWSTCFEGFSVEQRAEIEAITGENSGEFLRRLEQTVSRADFNFQNYRQSLTKGQKLAAAHELIGDLESLFKKLNSPYLGGLQTQLHFLLARSEVKPQEFLDGLKRDIKLLEECADTARQAINDFEPDSKSKEHRGELARAVADLFRVVLQEKPTTTYQPESKGKFGRVLKVCFDALGDKGVSIKDLAREHGGE